MVDVFVVERVPEDREDRARDDRDELVLYECDPDEAPVLYHRWCVECKNRSALMMNYCNGLCPEFEQWTLSGCERERANARRRWLRVVTCKSTRQVVMAVPDKEVSRE